MNFEELKKLLDKNGIAYRERCEIKYYMNIYTNNEDITDLWVNIPDNSSSFRIGGIINGKYYSDNCRKDMNGLIDKLHCLIQHKGINTKKANYKN